MRPALIGILGKKRSGKDTLAARLVEAHGFTRFALADPIRAGLLELNPILPFGSHPGTFATPPLRLAEWVAVYGWERAKETPEVRRLLQHFGTGLRDHLGADVWVDALRRKISDFPGSVVITDVRFKNEVQMIESLSGVTIRVTRPDLVSTDTHISEVALDGYCADFGVVNDGTIADLSEEVDHLVEVRFPSMR